MELDRNQSDKWGGDWTADKMDIFLKYSIAFLEIMKNQKFKILYFDGFAGSGEIKRQGIEKEVEGTAMEVLALSSGKEFDFYYLVELDREKAELLRERVEKKFPGKSGRVHIVDKDCNERLVAFAEFMKRNRNYRALGFLDPFGMRISYSSLKNFEKLGCDMWILFPSGIGVNRMLPRNEARMSDAWYSRISDVTGLSVEEIKNEFYRQSEQLSLFGQPPLQKKPGSIDQIVQIYRAQLNKIWEYVSEPFAMKNSTNSVMFHFLLASQNKNAAKIANDIIKSKS